MAPRSRGFGPGLGGGIGLGVGIERARRRAREGRSDAGARTGLRLACGAIVAALALGASPARAEVQPFRSQRFLPSSNGRASIAFDAVAGKLTHFFENPYRFPSAGTESRNFAFDAYPGVRAGGAGTWLASVTPSSVEYVPGTGVVHVKRAAGGLEIDEYHFAPIALAEHAAVMLLEVKRTSGSGPVDAYALYNFHLGAGSPAPSAIGEEAIYSASRDAFYEYGPAGLTFAYGSIGGSSKHAAGAPSSGEDPYAALLAGQDLANDAGTTGPTNDVAIGLQASLGAPAVGASAWAGWYVTTGLDSDVEPVVDRVRTWIAGRSPDAILADEIAAWGAWHSTPPAAASTIEKSVFGQAEAVLRMGQVRASGKADGQILASLAPGQWNVAWVRDMAYATVALARLGHVEEAERAIRFQLGATADHYETYVGKPYAISVVRYFGEGVEESDTNADGPNVEFDGFGLFLWELAETIRASNDVALLNEVLPRVRAEVGDVLVSLQDPTTGLIGKDSSIWEVHWNGKEEHFAYTTITAAKGLCELASLVDRAGDAAGASAYRDAGRKARDAILTYLRAPSGAIVQSVEALARGENFLDAAAVEAMNLGLVHPRGRSARATLDALQSALVPPSGRGFFRNQKGGWYDSQEWVFVDLRTTRALDLAGDAAAAPLLGWNVAQAADNFGLFAELHDRVSADYRGEVPMVGFGAGSYVLAMLDRGQPVLPACGEFADAPIEAPGEDAGLPTDLPHSDPDVDAGGAPIADETPPPSESPGGCACGVAGRSAEHASLAGSLFAIAIALATATARTRVVARRRRRAPMRRP
jgi:GH15 family glucan-1,4-alpha-glucosidase